MYDYGARFYMPDLGRWGVVDPLASTTFNIYDYANNNPIYYIDPTGMFNVPGEPVLSRNALGGDNNPIPIQEVIINRPLRAIASRPGSIMPNNCVTCYSGSGMIMDIPLNNHPLPQLPKNWDCGHCNDRGVIMMDSMWDALGIVIANNMSSDNQYAMMGLGALAIVLSKGQATDEVLKAELAIEKAETATIYRNFGWNELKSVKDAGGKFSIHPNQFQGKQFWVGETGMKMWTNSSFAKPFTAKISIPKSFVTPGHKNYIFMERDMVIDGFPGGTVLPNQLDKFNSAIKVDWIRY